MDCICKMLRKDIVRRYALIDEKEEIGHVYLYLIENDLHDKPYGLIEDLFIIEEKRGWGLGKELMRHIIEEAREIGCYKLIATSRDEKERVHKFYKELGFKEWGREFRIDF